MKYFKYFLSFCLVVFGCSNINNSLENYTNNDNNYKIGSRGQGGGIIFYDKGYYDDSGWRYIEVTDFDVSMSAPFGGYMQSLGTSFYVGAGKSNTELIVNVIGDGNYAAKLCMDLIYNGYNDWYLPSKDELNLIYYNLKEPNLVQFSADKYWSSSQYDASHSYLQQFSDGKQSGYRKDLTARVLAIRYF